MSNEYTIEVKLRNTGKHAARKLRSEEWAPAVVYGRDIDNASIALEQKYLDKYKSILRDNPIFVFKSDDKNLDGQRAVLKDIVYHPVKRRATHVDFYAIAAGQAITIDVKIHFFGTPKGVKAGGVLSTPVTSIEVECLPKDMPSSIEYDISELDLDESLQVKHLKIPENVTVLTAEDITIATIAEVREEVEVAAAGSEVDEMAAANAAVKGGESAETKTEKKD